MASPTYYLTIKDKVENELTLAVAACNNPDQSAPQQAFFVCSAILDAFYQRYKVDYHIKKLEEGTMKWKADVDEHPYATLFKLNVHYLERWLGDFGDMEDLSIYEENKLDFIAGFKDDSALSVYCEHLKSFPKLSDMIEEITVIENGVYSFDESSEELAMKVLKIKVKDKDFINHCKKGTAWEIYWW